MDKSSLRSGDIATGIVLTAGSVAVIISSYKMTLPVLAQGHAFSSSPGLVPGILAFFMLVMSISLICRGRCEGGSLRFLLPAGIWAGIRSVEGKNTLFIFGLIAFYIFALLRALPYCVATFIFLYVFILVYYEKRYLYVGLIALVCSLLITYSFGVLAEIPLPGKTLRFILPGSGMTITIP